MNKVKIGINFDKVMYKGDSLSTEINNTAIEFILSVVKKHNVQLYVQSDKNVVLFGICRMKRWLRLELKRWLLLSKTTADKTELSGIKLLPEITTYMLSDDTILDKIVQTWIDQVMDRIKWPIWMYAKMDIVVDEESLFMSYIWDSPYLNAEI
jgi:hypothetical protein